MSKNQADIDLPIPEDEEHLIEIMEERLGRELSETEQNVAIAQAKLIGDI